MLTRDENDLLCRVGPDTPMGKMLRRYWVPAATSGEIASDAAPKRIRLLGEDLVAFRDDRGRVGLLDESCPHRGASLALARHEGCGLRCLYHGWKLDAQGNVLETPPEPDEYGFRLRTHAKAYPVRERGGIVWTYMGPPGEEPAPPDFEWTSLPDDHRWLGKMRAECNWVQCLEGVIDSSHVSYLHSDAFAATSSVERSALVQDGTIARPSVDGRPRIDVQNTAYGFRYAAIRKPVADADRFEYVRVTLFVAPFYVLTPSSADFVAMHMFVPIDDEHTMFYYAKTSYEKPTDVERFRELHASRSGMRPGVDVDEDFRKSRTRANNWRQDRGAMRAGTSATGIRGVTMQDFCVVESMGPIYDRSKEHLGASDVAVIRMRRLMLESVKRFTEDGEPPLGLRDPVAYDKLRAEDQMLPIGVPWQVVGALGDERTVPV